MAIAAEPAPAKFEFDRNERRQMVSGHVFIATSLDGYIARADGDIGWLLERDDPAEDHGYAEFIADKDMIVMGRGSFEKVLTMGPWAYDRPVLVLSRQLAGKPVPEPLQGKVRFSDCAPRDAMAELAAEGAHRVYVDGGQVVQSFLREGLITDLVVTTVPVLIGTGRPLFGALPRDVDLALESSRHFPSGLVQSKYRVLG
uniref:Bifunctional deaminase-reductase, C-terminal n=2 Tax=Burkholderiaceae TaxID=119060 RepID=Q470A8_CUPPJ